MADIDEQLLELLLGTTSAQPGRLCGSVVCRAAGRLEELEGGTERLDHEAMKRDLRTAGLLLTLGAERGEEGRGQAMGQLMQQVCLPYLDVLFKDCEDRLECVQVVAETMARVLQDPVLPAEVAVTVLREGVCPLLTSKREEGGLDSADRLATLTNFLCGMFCKASPDSLQHIPGCAEQLSAIFSLLLSLLSRVPTATCHLLMAFLLPPFITPAHTHRLSALWGMVQEVWHGQRLVELHPLTFSLALFCCFSDVLIAREHASPFLGGFPASVADLCPLLDVCSEGILWEVLGAGLRSNDPLNRKRSMYLLDRVLSSVKGGGGEVMSEGGVFWWRRECEVVLSAVWEDVVLVLHTLEEKQLHIVKPVKSRMKAIVQATNTYIDGHSVLHVSWLELVLERVFVHTEAKSIVKWGVSEALSLDLASSPLLLHTHWKFVFGPLLAVLSDTKLYTQDQHATASALCPPVASLLTAFLQNFLTHLSQPLRAEFMHGLLVAIEAADMSETPLLHMTHSLSLLPPAPLLDPASLLVVRSIMSRLDTHRGLLRAAVMTFLLTTAANLSDLSVVGYYEVAMVLGGVGTTDCLMFSSPTWRKMCEWLAAMAAASDVPLSSFLTDSLTSLLDPCGQGVGPSHASLALLVLLAVDAHLRGLQCLPASPEQLLSSLLLPLASILVSASSRPYLPPHSLTLSLHTLTSLITSFLSGNSLSHTYWSGPQSETGQILFKCLSPWLPDIIQNLQELLMKGSKDGHTISLPYITLLTSSLSSLYTFTALYGFSWSANSSTCPAHLATLALQTLLSSIQTDQVTVLTAAVMGSLSALGWVCAEDVPLPPPTFSSLLCLPLSLKLTRPTAKEYVEWGPIMEWCEAMHWTVMRYCLHYLYKEESDYTLGGVACRADACAVWDVCVDSVGGVATSQLPCVLDCLSLLLPQVELGVVPDAVRCCWRAVGYSLPALPSLLGLLLHPDLLLSSDAVAVELVDQVCSELMALGGRRGGVVNVLATKLCEGWWSEWDRGERPRERLGESLLRHQSLLMQLCCFGSVGRRSLRSLVDSERFVQLLGDCVAVNCTATKSSGLQGDAGVRATILSFLVGVASKGGLLLFLPEFVTAIVHKLSELTASKPRYFINSLTHRLKQRLLQTLLLLLPHLPPDREEGVAREIMLAMQSDNQTSVRHLLEWAAMWLMSRQPPLISSLLLPALQPDSGFRLSRLPSLFTVAMHLSRAGHAEERVEYCQRVLPVLFQWTTCHHFVVRLYAQRTVEVLWEANKECVGERGGHTLIDSCIPFLKKHSDAARFRQKLDKNVFFSLFSPLSDLSVEALFDFLPRLCGMAEEDCVSAGDFCEPWERWGGGEARLPLHCENSALCAVVKSEEVRGEECVGMASSGEGAVWDGGRGVWDGGKGVWDGRRGEEWEVGEGDMQKKITRWASGAGVLQELFPGLSQETEATVTGGLIVVASLLSKIPNLGGLCRTCEIFGVRELVVASVAAVEDAQFTALSVSAQHWLKISEVQLSQLPSYLLGMRSAGYQLVGAEQTAQSKCITSYDFHPRTLLLLGNEREGIPVPLLHLVEECVQIPQLGVVRSLNVHVSGALLIWEYCKQHLISHPCQ